MSKFCTILAVTIAGAFAPAAFCATSLQDYGFDVNGTWYSATTAVPGLTSSGFNTTTGQGTLTFTFNPGAAGTYNIDSWIFDALSVPFYNEYGTKSGSAASGQSWQIDIPDYDSDADHTGTIVANTQAAKLDNTNHIPGTADDYLGTCATGSNCNDATSMAMGFKFTLTSTQEETITLSLSQTNPGGFYLEQIHPVDGGNASATDLFFSGTAVLGGPPPPPPTSPEPASWALLAAGFVAAGLTQRRRLFKA